MQKWEYRVIVGKKYVGEDYLNKLGVQGWEIVAVVAGSLESPEGSHVQPQSDASEVYIYFKRPKSE
ncbi:MAG: hypothetical protein QOD32_3155 [Pyrinomonadaceae bacterium]|jgi:hypothetical protein|nr:hypothetical protein [Pyrinomonadaceae bacterium]